VADVPSGLSLTPSSPKKKKKVGVGQLAMEKCLGSGQGLNWAVHPLVIVVSSEWLRTANEVVLTRFGML
jgi:hypothetical protein